MLKARCPLILIFGVSLLMADFFLNIKIGYLISVRLKMIPYLRSIREGLIVRRGPLVKAKMGQKQMY